MGVTSMAGVTGGPGALSSPESVALRLTEQAAASPAQFPSQETCCGPLICLPSKLSGHRGAAGLGPWWRTHLHRWLEAAPRPCLKGRPALGPSGELLAWRWPFASPNFSRSEKKIGLMEPNLAVCYGLN